MRSLSGLVVVLSLAACTEEPRGQLEPIPRPPGMKDTPKAEAPGQQPEAAPVVDPSKVVLRWKLGEGAPVAYRLTLDRTGAAPAAPAEEEKPAKGRKGKDKEAPKVERAPAAAAVAFPSALTYVLARGDTGDFQLRVVPEGNSAAEDTGTMSERGFVLDGLQGITRNTAALVLELPLAAVGPNDIWALGTELLTHDALGPQFTIGKTERRNRVKLASLTPADGGEQVATLEYDLLEQLSGKVTTRRAPSPVPARASDPEENHDSEPTPSAADASAEVRIVGRGEFLVKAGRWRSWEGSIASSTKGTFPVTALQVPPGTVKLKLTALESAPAPAAPQPTAKPQP